MEVELAFEICASVDDFQLLLMKEILGIFALVLSWDERSHMVMVSGWWRVVIGWQHDRPGWSWCEPTTLEINDKTMSLRKIRPQLRHLEEYFQFYNFP